MKYIALVSLFLCNLLVAQKDLKIEIINDTIKKVSYYDACNIFYSITNNSKKDYLLLVDSEYFNEDSEQIVEPFFIGLPDYFVYKNTDSLSAKFSFGSHPEIKTKPENYLDDFKNFTKLFAKKFDEYDLKVAYRVKKIIVHLKPEEKRMFTTKINFPMYRGKYFDFKNKESYYFQISLNNPKEIIEKYEEVLKKYSKENETIFIGEIISNKIPLVYEVYNDGQN